MLWKEKWSEGIIYPNFFPPSGFRLKTILWAKVFKMFIFPTLHSNTYNHPKTGKCWKNCCFRVNFLTPCEFPNIWQSSLNGICHLLLLLHFVTISYTFSSNLPEVYKKMLLRHFPFFCFRSLVMVSKHQQPMGFTRNVCFSLEMKKNQL